VINQDAATEPILSRPNIEFSGGAESSDKLTVHTD
jgi:hypothetical protein